jgi:hypothetical protein
MGEQGVSNDRDQARLTNLGLTDPETAYWVGMRCPAKGAGIGIHLRVLDLQMGWDYLRGPSVGGSRGYQQAELSSPPPKVAIHLGERWGELPFSMC